VLVAGLSKRAGWGNKSWPNLLHFIDDSGESSHNKEAFSSHRCRLINRSQLFIFVILWKESSQGLHSRRAVTAGRPSFPDFLPDPADPIEFGGRLAGSECYGGTPLG